MRDCIHVMQMGFGVASFATKELASQALEAKVVWSNRQVAKIGHRA